MTQNYVKHLIYLIFAVFILKFIVLWIYPLHHPSEARYAAIAMRMVISDNFLMPFFDPVTPFLGKPPLAFWASALSIKMFGISVGVARIPQFLALVLSCLFLYHCLKRLYNQQTALVAVLLLSSSALFYMLHSVMTEAFLLLGMTITIFSFWCQIQSEKKNIYGYLVFVGCAISMMTKGPAGVLMPAFSIFVYILISSRWKELWQKFPLFLGTLIFLVFVVPWFYLAAKSYPDFLEYFFIGENFNRFANAGWSGDRYGHAHKVVFGAIWGFFIFATMPIVLLLLFRPKEIIGNVITKFKQDKKQDWSFFLLSFLVPMVVLTFMRNMIGTYAIYALIPFVVLIAKIIVEKAWNKLVYAISVFTITIYLLIIGLFLFSPGNLMEHLNYQNYLVSKIPPEKLKDSHFQLDYMGFDYGIYTFYWHTKDKLKLIKNDEELLKEFEGYNPAKYLISESLDHSKLPLKYQGRLKKIFCTTKRNACLYEFTS